MQSIIVAFPKLEDANAMKNILIRSGYEVHTVCTTGSQVLSLVNELDQGIIITSERLRDIHYIELYDCLPKSFALLLITKASHLTESMEERVVSLCTPIKTRELINTVEWMLQSTRQTKKSVASHIPWKNTKAREGNCANETDNRVERSIAEDKNCTSNSENSNNKTSARNHTLEVKQTLRTEKEQETIRHAKLLLMERNHIMEWEAHRYLQKQSMNQGISLCEVAQLILEDDLT